MRAEYGATDWGPDVIITGGALTFGGVKYSVRLALSLCYPDPISTMLNLMLPPTLATPTRWGASLRPSTSTAVRYGMEFDFTSMPAPIHEPGLRIGA